MKKNHEQFKNFFHSVISIILLLSQTAVFSYVWITRYNNYIVLPFVQRGNLFIYTIYIILLYLFMRAFDGLKFGRYHGLNLAIGQILACIATAAVVYIQTVLMAAKFVTVKPLLAMLFFNALICFSISFGGNYLLKLIFPAKKTVLVYDTYSPTAFIEKLSARKDKFTVYDVVNIDVGLEKLEEIIKNAQAVIIYDVHSESRNKILKMCFENNIRAYATTKVSDILIRSSECLHLFDTPILLYHNNGLTFEQRFFKRLTDIVVSVFMLIIASPFLLISAIAIKLYDGGPVIFKQARSTLGGEVFYIHKFRSMIVDAEKDGVRPAESHDPRITPVGKVLRATRLDELPQLFDILMGNMSLVGPRPERIEHVQKYTEEIPEFQYRLKVKGGLTGYAQIYGKYNTSAYDKLQLDLMYIQNYSYLLDIRLILMTLKIMFIRESTEGFKKEQSDKLKNDKK